CLPGLRRIVTILPLSVLLKATRSSYQKRTVSIWFQYLRKTYIMSLTTANITQLQAGIREGRWTRQDIIAAHLERIEQINPMTNTFVEVRAAKVLEEASAADRKF